MSRNRSRQTGAKKWRFGLPLVLLAALASVALTSASPALAGSTNTIPLHGVPADEGTDCPDQEEAYWHFVLAPNQDSSFVSITLNLANPSEFFTVEPGDAEWIEGSGPDNVFVKVPDNHDIDDLIQAGSFAVWSGDEPNLFNLSHVCSGDGEEAATASISTEIHADPDPDPQDEEAGPKEIIPVTDPLTQIDFGSEVHDSASLTSDPTPVELPEDSSVTFYFYEDGECDDSGEGVPGNSVDSETVDVGSESTPLSLDPHLAQGPLLAGQYSYRAFFTSGDTDLIIDATSACEPFEVLTASASISTEIHYDPDPEEGDPVVIPVADPLTQIPFGSEVHDSASLTSTPTPVTLPDGSSVTFYFYEDGECDDSDATDPGDYFASEAEDVGGESTPVSLDPHLAQGPILKAGQYSYRAFFTSGDTTGVITDATSACEPFEVLIASASISTELHYDPDPAEGDPVVIPVDPLTQIALGSEVHDSASLTSDPTPITLPDGSSVTFYFYEDGECDDSDATDPGDYFASEDEDVGGESTPVSLDPHLVQGPLVPGQYSYRAFFTSGNATEVITDATSACEPFEVEPGDTTTVTEVHDADHNDITNSGVAPGSYVHDKAIVEHDAADGDPDTPFPITGNVKFSFYNNNTCAYSGLVNTETVDLEVTDESTPKLINTPGLYSYKAEYLGDDNYNGSTGECEPFSVFQHGKTMGFWGNPVGQARLAGDPDGNPNTPGNAFNTNPVLLGLADVDLTHKRCNILVNTAAKSVTILPVNGNLNGASLEPDCDTSGERDSVQANSFNVLLAQTLALSYNILYINAYAGQTIGLLSCTAVGTLSGASTVEQVRAYANGLIGNAIKNQGSSAVTQGQVGDLNTLLGCLNREV